MAGFRAYLDTSVVLRRLLRQPAAIRRWSRWESAVTSELMEVEALRTLDRLRLTGELSSVQFAGYVSALRAIANGLEVVSVSSAILKRASASFATPLGTLDAIHLATAFLWMEVNSQELIFVTHDRQRAVAAQVSGLELFPG